MCLGIFLGIFHFVFRVFSPDLATSRGACFLEVEALPVGKYNCLAIGKHLFSRLLANPSYERVGNFTRLIQSNAINNSVV
jgi:hypothetical protein